MSVLVALRRVFMRAARSVTPPRQLVAEVSKGVQTCDVDVRDAFGVEDEVVWG